MPKRKNPFGEAVPVQLKTHVTAKHVASKKDMEEVYRRTREVLLKNGREKSHLVNAGQENGRAVEERCKCCRSWLGPHGLLCSQCQVKVCSSTCLRECCTCGQSFCHFCTVLNYDEPQVRTFCLNCLSSFSF